MLNVHKCDSPVRTVTTGAGFIVADGIMTK